MDLLLAGSPVLVDRAVEHADLAVDQAAERGAEVGDGAAEGAAPVGHVAIDEAAHPDREDVDEVAARRLLLVRQVREATDVDRARLARGDGRAVLVEAVLEAQRLAKIAARALADDPEARALRPLCPRRHQPGHDLVDRAVAADGDHRLAALERGLAGDLHRVTPALGEGRVEAAEAALDRVRHLGEQRAGSTAAGARVHDQERFHRAIRSAGVEGRRQPIARWWETWRPHRPPRE